MNVSKHIPIRFDQDLIYKNLFFSLLFLLSTYHASAQAIPINGSWIINDISFDYSSPNYPVGIAGDTSLAGAQYYQLRSSSDSLNWSAVNSEYLGAIREVGGEWYIRLADDTSEHLYYKFDAHEGDTIELRYGTVVVRSIDTILMLDGTKRKRLEVSDTFNAFPEFWIEGVGSSNGLIYSGFHVFDVGHQLICFHLEGNLIYRNSPNNMCYYSGSELVEKNQLRIYPNPAKRSIQIEIKDAGDYTIHLYNGQGRLIRSEKVRDGYRSIDVENLAPGFYSIRTRERGSGHWVTHKVQIHE